MIPLSDVLSLAMARLQTAMEARTAPAPKAEPEAPTPLLGVLAPFEPCGDPVLEKMLSAARQYLTAVSRKKPAYWLTLWGRNPIGNGTGKTMLASLMKKALQAMLPSRDLEESKTHEGKPYRVYDRRQTGIKWVEWAKWCHLTRNPDTQRRADQMYEDMLTARCVILDDIGAERQTENSMERLYSLLNARLGKWTILTSNLSPDDWKGIDSRISSRMIRDGNVHVCCETTDFALRTKPKKAP